MRHLSAPALAMSLVLTACGGAQDDQPTTASSPSTTEETSPAQPPAPVMGRRGDPDRSDPTDRTVGATGGATAGGTATAMSDAQIAAVVSAADRAEIEAGELARSRAQHPEV